MKEAAKRRARPAVAKKGSGRTARKAPRKGSGQAGRKRRAKGRAGSSATTAAAAAAGRGRRPADRHSIRATKSEAETLRRQTVQYMDSGGYVSWSAKKRQYMILGTSFTEGGLVSCPSCGIGQLLVIKSPRTGKRFMGCSNFYGGCDASSPLLQRARLRATKKACGTCAWPEVIFRYSSKQKWTRQCSNIECPTRGQARKDG